MNRAATIALAPLSVLYRTAMQTRAALYQRGLFSKHKVNAPVISVGNLTTGGTGKTPLVEAIARRLALAGRRVCILTRGYGRANSRQRIVVSDGHQILAEVTQTGDEPLMLAEKLKGKAAVICDADRVSAAHYAQENLASDVFILDDGFQNLRIFRDVNILMIDATNPWGNKMVLPAGILREPIKALRRADCIVLTRTDQSNESAIRQQVDKITDAPLLSSRMVASGIRSIKLPGNVQAKALVARQPVAAFCAVGNPDGFFDLLRGDFDLTDTTAFRDHHRYAQSDIDRTASKAIASGARALITTAKDEVKLRALRFDLPCYVVDIEIEISPDDKLFNLIDRAINKS